MSKSVISGSDVILELSVHYKSRVLVHVFHIHVFGKWDIFLTHTNNFAAEL